MVSNLDPPFVTPDIKLLLRHKNSLMRKGRIEAADEITELIRRKIINKNSEFLSNQIRGSKDLWTAVNASLGKGKNFVARNFCSTAES